MINQKILSTIMIIIDLCASILYWFNGNWRMGLYWLFAAYCAMCLYQWINYSSYLLSIQQMLKGKVELWIL